MSFFITTLYREPVLPSDVHQESDSKDPQPMVMEPDVSEQATRQLREVRERVLKNIEAAQATQKRNYDRRSRASEVCFK
jgi:hypothetical protein